MKKLVFLFAMIVAPALCAKGVQAQVTDLNDRTQLQNILTNMPDIP